MAQPYVGEIRMFAGNFAPAGWEFCNGQMLPISENEVLFQLLGTTYGGDGEASFALPNLQSRIPMHIGSAPGLTDRKLGEAGGAEQVTLTIDQLPPHRHALAASTQPGVQAAADGALPAAGGRMLHQGPANQALSPQSVSASGGGQPHDNMHPFLSINFIISLFGIYPSQS